MKKLVLLWLSLTFVHFLSSDISLSVVTKSHNDPIFSRIKTPAILAGQKITGEIYAAYNNLGIVSIRFNTFHRNNQDFIIFRLKEKGNKNWYYQNKYDALQFIDNQHYPFGFAVIKDSKGKHYEVELESILGSPKNSVGLSSQPPIVITKYQFSRNDLFALIPNKLMSSVENHYLFFATFVFFTPILLKVISSSLIASFLVFMLALYDIIFIDDIYDLIIFTLVMNITLFAVKKNSQKVFVWALVYLFIAFIGNLLGQPLLTEKSAIYAFLLLGAGTVISFIRLFL